MKNLLDKISFFKSLRWKISLMVIVIIFIVLFAISIIIYNATSEIVREQADQKIQLVSNSYKNSVNSFIKRIDTQMKMIIEDSSSSSLYGYYSLLTAMYPGAQATKNDMDSFFSFMDGLVSIRYTSTYKLMSQLEHAKFVYATLPNGLTILDSRATSDNTEEQETKYIKNQLEDSFYKDIRFGKLFSLDGEQYLLYNRPVFKEGTEEIWGYIIIGFSPEIIDHEIAHIDSDDGGNYTLINNSGMILRTDQKELLGSKIDQQWYLDQINQGKDYNLQETGEKYLLYNKVSDNLSLAVEIPMENLLEPVNNVERTIWFAAGLLMLIGFVMAFFFITRELKALGGFLQAFNSMKNGDLTNNIKLNQKYLRRKDEIAVMASTFNEMIEDLRKLVDGIKHQSHELADSTDMMNSTSQEIGTMAEQVGASIQTVSAGAEEQIAQIEETSNNVINFNKQIMIIDSKAKEISNGADNVHESIRKGKSAVLDSIDKIDHVSEETANVSELVSELGKMSQEIGNIVDLISSIAKQTNLLALNAAIEAARAGQAGQGFSVVADEIRMLAEQSSTATKKIAYLIGNIQDSVNSAVDVMGRNEGLVAESVTAIKDTDIVFSEIEEVSTALRNSITVVVDGLKEMTVESQYVKEAIKDISTISKEFANNSEEIAASSEEQIASTEEIVSAAERLKDMSELLMDNVNKFNL